MLPTSDVGKGHHKIPILGIDADAITSFGEAVR
jgi:hypothetical protein